MSDLERAMDTLSSHSICLCKGGAVLTDDGRGISPMMKFLAEGRDLSGYSAADQIVGKAVAMLFLKAGICAVYGKVMSIAAKTLLESRGIPVRCDTLTERIINRQGTGICPMEEAVAHTDDIDTAYALLREKLRALQAQKAHINLQ